MTPFYRHCEERSNLTFFPSLPSLLQFPGDVSAAKVRWHCGTRRHQGTSAKLNTTMSILNKKITGGTTATSV